MYKILIATADNILANYLIADLPENYSSFICNRGDELPQLLSSIKPDILIVALTLPVIDGMTALELSSYSPPVVLALTTYWNNEIIGASKRAGIGCLIELPCSIETIISNLQRLVAKKLHSKIPSLDQ